MVFEIGRARSAFVPFILACALGSPAASFAQASGPEVEALRAEVRELRRRDEENRRRIEELARAVEALSGNGAATPASALDAALIDASAAAPASAGAAPATNAGTAPSAKASTAAGAETPRARFIDLSVDTVIAAGGSTASGDELEELQAGGHDPRHNGFTLQQAEISFAGAVDPYFTAEAHVVASEHGIELEEAFLTTSALPGGLQLEAGYFFTEFGLLNPRHPHEWQFMDVSVVNARLLGEEGLRSAGARLGWLMPLPWPSELHLGVQNAENEELTASFIAGEPVGGRPSVDRDLHGLDELLYLARWTNAWEHGSDWTTTFGASGLYGPNDTGSDGHTWIYGGDLRVKWSPSSNFRGFPYVLWQSEVLGRSYHADRFDDGASMLASSTLRDWGLYTQAIWGFQPRWSAGLRFEYATASGAGLDETGASISRSSDPLRSTRYRFSPLLAWQPSHFSRLRLQYNYDHAGSLAGEDAHTLWLGIEVLYGAHPAHKY